RRQTGGSAIDLGKRSGEARRSRVRAKGRFEAQGPGTHGYLYRPLRELLPHDSCWWSASRNDAGGSAGTDASEEGGISQEKGGRGGGGSSCLILSANGTHHIGPG